MDQMAYVFADILTLLRDPIWTFIGVVVSVVAIWMTVRSQGHSSQPAPLPGTGTPIPSRQPQFIKVATISLIVFGAGLLWTFVGAVSSSSCTQPSSCLGDALGVALVAILIFAVSAVVFVVAWIMGIVRATRLRHWRWLVAMLCSILLALLPLIPNTAGPHNLLVLVPVLVTLGYGITTPEQRPA